MAALSREPSAAHEPPVIRCRHLAKAFAEDGLRVVVLQDVNLEIQAGDQLAILGVSGAGKSTLLHLLGGLDQPTTGEIEVAGQRLDALSDAARSRLRNQALGFVYQFHHLLPEFTALENVALPLLIRGVRPLEAQDRADAILTRVGLAQRLEHKPGELSGGERQRVAIARALVTEPRALLADEPTGNLDRKTALQVQDLMLELNAALGTSLIVVTHDLRLAERMDHVYLLEDGRLNPHALGAQP